MRRKWEKIRKNFHEYSFIPILRDLREWDTRLTNRDSRGRQRRGNEIEKGRAGRGIKRRNREEKKKEKKEKYLKKYFSVINF